MLDVGRCLDARNEQSVRRESHSDSDSDLSPICLNRCDKPPKQCRQKCRGERAEPACEQVVLYADIEHGASVCDCEEAEQKVGQGNGYCYTSDAEWSNESKAKSEIESRLHQR
jgi:hypothetical protein